MAVFFRQSKELEMRIDDFLDGVSQGCTLFKLGVADYLEGRKDAFAERIKSINESEAKADALRRDIENRLYTHSLIPDHRGDVLGLLETLDDVVDNAKETINQFSVEKPDIPPALNREYLELATACVESAEAIVSASRAFFKDINAVQNYLHKVYFFEKEADKISDRLKRMIFDMDIPLSNKIHLRYFTLHVDTLADRAEAVADRLAIYTIKRTL